MEYKIPEEILSKIPQHFWPAFAGELVSTLGLGVFDKENDYYVLYDVSGTFGWNAAFRMTCNKLEMKWLYEYYDKLEWWESDRFDSEVEDLLIKNFVEVEATPANTYYAWLIGDSNERID